MTTIVIDIENRAIYSDRRSTRSFAISGGSNDDDEDIFDQFADNTDKVWEKNGFIFTGSGYLSDLVDFAVKYDSGKLPKPKHSHSTAIAFTPDGEIVVYQPKEIKKYFLPNYYMWDVVSHLNDKKYFAIGSGCHYAMGALESGATAKEAMQIAGKLDRKTSTKYSVSVF